MPEKTLSGYITRSVVQFAADQGVDMATLYAATGLDPMILTLPDERISRSLHSAVWREVIKQTHCESLGLHLGAAFSLANYGIAGYVLLNCQTLQEVFEKFCRYSCLFCQGTLSRLSISDGIAFFDYDYLADAASEDCFSDRYDTEKIFAATMTAVKALTGKSLQPVAVWFRHQPPADLSEYDRFFQTDLKFAMPINRIIFDAACLDWSVLSSNANLLPLFEQQAEEMLEQLHRDDRWTQKVTAAILQQLKGELPAIDKIAAELAMSTRQLQRELKAEGTSFQKLLDLIRQELALRYLKDPTIPIHDIAFLLGFSEPSAFNRAFKRWSGKTPSSYRLERRMDS